MQKGDIVLVPFPFTDLTGTKLRPALVLFSLGDDVVIVFISTTTKIKGEYEILIKKSKTNSLKSDSILKLSKIVTLDKKLMIGRIGRAEEDILEQINQRLLKMFDLR